jgi:LuxR family maltose regulon positive regulatory protein
VITGIFVELLLIALVRVLLAQGRRNKDVAVLDQALRLSVRLLRFAEEQGQLGTAIEILVLQAQVYQALGDLSTALVTLLRALTRGEAEGFCRTFVDEGEPMAQLLAQLSTLPGADGEPAAGARLGYVQRLCAVMASDAPEEEAAGVVPEFSGRELEILRLMAQGMTDQEIGNVLHISINTVKTHLRRVYGKLDVHSRTQALHRAGRLGLLA